jgi:hypothetical protein
MSRTVKFRHLGHDVRDAPGPLVQPVPGQAHEHGQQQQARERAGGPHRAAGEKTAAAESEKAGDESQVLAVGEHADLARDPTDQRQLEEEASRLET